MLPDALAPVDMTDHKGESPVRLYNTLTRDKQDFVPLDPARITLYACGPTVYNYAHIGNARPAVVFDLLRRLLEVHYPRVDYARNITDVDDKINQAAADEGVAIDVVSRRYTEAYHADMAALGVQPPTVEPRATGHVPEMIAMIERLIEGGHAYAAEGHVLFAIESYAEYGHLSRRDMRELVAGARVDVAPYKRHPGDFVLWKPSPDDLPGWDSPWGRGRPGWHLECSAMAEKHLGETIDIHAGGLDLVFPHHENEIAQSTCAHDGRTFARYWLHNGFVTVEGRKMSKSLGNVIIVHDLLEEHRGEVLRYLLLSAHYRQPLDWSTDALTKSRRTLDRLYGVLRDAGERWQDLAPDPQPPAALLEALGDDLNTPEALAVLNRLARDLGRADDAAAAHRAGGALLAAAHLLGLLQDDPNQWFEGEGNADEAEIDALIAERERARRDRDFARADQIRDDLAARGIVLEDVAGGTRWRRDQ